MFNLDLLMFLIKLINALNGVDFLAAVGAASIAVFDNREQALVVERVTALEDRDIFSLLDPVSFFQNFQNCEL